MKGIEIAGFAASVDRWKGTSRCRLEPEGERKRKQESAIKDTMISLQLSSSFLLSGDFSEDSQISLMYYFDSTSRARQVFADLLSNFIEHRKTAIRDMILIVKQYYLIVKFLLNRFSLSLSLSLSLKDMDNFDIKLSPLT